MVLSSLNLGTTTVELCGETPTRSAVTSLFSWEGDRGAVQNKPASLSRCISIIVVVVLMPCSVYYTVNIRFVSPTQQIGVATSQ